MNVKSHRKPGFMLFKSMGNRVGSVPFVVFIAALLIYPSLQRKIQVGLWHLWNGNTTRVQEYDIPVPTGWVARKSDVGSVAILEMGTYRWRDELGSSINIRTSGSNDLTFLSALHEQWFESKRAHIFDRRTIDLESEKVDCIVSNALVHKLPVPNDKIASIDCESTAGLSINFNGDKEHIDTFFSVVSQIRKHEPLHK